MTLEILYKDNHLIAVNKPANLLTQSDTLPNCEDMVKDWVKKEWNKEGKVFLHAVHRLDKEVSGIVLFAKSSKALSRMHEEMRSRRVKKIYYALVEGEVEDEEGNLESYLIHGDRRAVISEKGHPEAKQALLHYKVIKRSNSRTLLEIDLVTGRYHQIRAQLSQIGHPIVGDQKYGSREKKERIFLHHSKLMFVHPTTKEKIAISSRVPFDKA